MSSSFAELARRLDGLEGRLSLTSILSELRASTIDEGDIEGAVRFDRERYARNRLVTRADYELIVIGWLPGQTSPIHDHAESACGVAVLRGSATETTFLAAGDGRARPMEARTFTSGEVFGSVGGDIHTLSNRDAGGRPLVTLHVYSPPLIRMGIYSPESAAPLDVGQADASSDSFDPFFQPSS